MNRNLKKIFGLAAVSACTFGFAMNANAATLDAAKEVCTASNVADLKDCTSGKGDYKDVNKVVIDTAITIDEAITFKNMDVDAGAVNVTVKSGNTVTITNGSFVTTGDLEVQSNANLNVTSDAADAVKAANIKILKGKVTVSADNTNGVVATDKNTANALNATTALTIDGGVVTVTKGIVKGTAINVDGKSTINVVDVNGPIIVTDSATDSTKATIKANDITGAVELNDSASLTANKIDGGVEANENATVNAKEISGTVDVDGKNASVQYASENSTVTVTQGIAKKTTVNQYGETHVDVEAVKVDSVDLAANETLIINNTTDINKGFTIKASKGAKIDNQTGDDLNLSINGESVTVSKDAKDDDAYVIESGKTEEPTNPEDPNKPVNPEDPNKPVNPGDDQPNKAPQTFDAILSYVGVALSSVGGLGVSLKKRLFR